MNALSVDPGLGDVYVPHHLGPPLPYRSHVPAAVSVT